MNAASQLLSRKLGKPAFDLIDPGCRCRREVYMVWCLMRIAILADIHGNVLALEAVLADLKHRSVDQFVNLGDCVSGPLWPRETAELLRQLNWPTVRGNHDRWVTDWPREKHYPSDAFAFEALDSPQLAWLRALPQTRELGDGVLLAMAVPMTTTPICWKMSRELASCRHGKQK